jgi:multidrug resistance efflux pump
MNWLESWRGKRWLWYVLGFIIVGVGTTAYFILRPSTEVQAQEPQMQTAAVRQGNLEVRASGSGVLIARDQHTLGFGTSGIVAELSVSAGDVVEAGNILAVQGEQEKLEAVVASSQLAVLNAQEALDAFYEDADLVAAQAQLNLAEAREALEDAEYDWSIAQRGNRASQSTLDAAAAELSLAESALKRAKDQLSQDPDNDMAKLNVANAEKRYNTALWSWNWYTGEPTNIQQDLLDAQLAIAQAKVAEAERAYAKVAEGPDPDEVTKLELQLENALASLEEAKSNLEKAVIQAPIDGTILEVNAGVGDSVSGGFITMADLSHPYVEIYLDETDLDKIDLDYEVEVVFDALPDDIFHGHVVQVDPSLYQAQMVSAIRGLVWLDEESTTKVARLPLGMNASVDIIVQGEELEVRVVQVSLIDITFAAVTDGLGPGEVVSTGIVEAE